MNEYMLQNAVRDLFGHAGADEPAKAIVTAVMRDGIDLDTGSLAAARQSALVAVALHPEHAPRALTMSPAERLAVFDRLVAIDPVRAAAFRDEAPGARAAVEMASKARERDRMALDGRRRELEQTAWAAEKRIAELMPVLESDVAAWERLAALRGAAALGTASAVEQRRARALAGKAEVDGLRKVAADARAESARLAEMRP